MRKTRLVILPTKCLHQMGFLLLFLSCPVIGDWGRIRPESESLHRAIQVEREGTCGLQRDPPGGLVDFLDGNGSDKCGLSEDHDSITEEATLKEVRTNEERRIDWERTSQRRDIRRTMRRTVDERRDVRRESQRRVGDERRDVRREWRRDAHREGSHVRSRSVELRRSREASPGRQREGERAVRRERMSPARETRKESGNEVRNERGRLEEARRESRRQDERRMELQRRAVREAGNERRENERAVRERDDVRRENRGLGRSLRRGERDSVGRRSREGSQDRQSERLSLARREETKERAGERRSLQIRDEVREQRKMRRVDSRRGVEMRRLVGLLEKGNERDVRGRRAGVFQEMADRKSRRLAEVRIAGDSKEVNELAGKGKGDELSGRISKWLDFKGYESFKAGDWTTNCVIGAVVYYLSTRQIKAI